MDETAFVTGGTGFIGSHLVEELLRRDCREVRCLVRTERKWLSGLPVVEVRGSLEDAGILRSALEGVDCVYHLAGVTRARDPESFHAGNVRATVSLLRAVAAAVPGVRKVVAAGSLAAVGRADRAMVDEAAPLRPLTRYGRSKAAMERAIAGHPSIRALPVVIIRPPAVYGPRDRDILTFFRAAAAGFCPIVGRRDEKSFSLVHVRDLVRAMVDAAQSEATAGRTYFVGSDEGVAWGELAAAAQAALGRRIRTVPIPRALVGQIGTAAEGAGRLFGRYPALNREKAREILHAAKMCSSDRARRDFGYRQRIGLEEGVRDTVAWYRAQGWLR